MFDVISSAKNTQWFSFPSLCTKYTYSHVANEAVDFQTLPGRNYFAEFNRKSGFELLRTVSKDYVESIQRIKKRQIEDLSCGAVSKLYDSELAIGMSTGVVRIFSIEKGDFIPAKFKPDKHGNSVIGLDYSNDDAYLAAVYESADICLFGMKTGVKTNSFALDGSSTSIRFHPARKFVLAIASYQGAVTMLDVQTKKKIFFEKAAHSAPTRDIAMFSSSQDVFISCGFDCNINVYDLRKKMMVQQYQQPHPMSTVCVSSCGTFCVGGNLKGDVISFDFRNMKEPMDCKRAHDSAVVRVAFIPAIGDASASICGQTINATAATTTIDSPLSSRRTSDNERESFAKFIDICRKNNMAPVNNSKASVHDSWADFMPVKQKHNFSNVSGALDSPGRLSIDSANRSELRLKRPSKISRHSFDHSIASDLSEGRSSGGSEDFALKSENFIEDVEMTPPPNARLPDTVPDKTPLSHKAKSNQPMLSPDTQFFAENINKHFLNGKTSTPSLDQFMSRRSRANVIKKDMHSLHEITEEITETDSPDKENHPSNGQIILPLENKTKNLSKCNEAGLITVNVNELRDIIRHQMSDLETNLIGQMNLIGDQIIDYVDNRVKEAENDANFQRELYFNKDFTVRFESTKHLERNMQTIEEGLAALLQEPVEEKYSEYQIELAELRQQQLERNS